MASSLPQSTTALNPLLSHLWLEATLRGDYATNEFWGYVLNKLAFPDYEWAVASRQPPTYDPSDHRRVDFAVDHYDHGGESRRLFVLAASGSSGVAEAERRALDACAATLEETGKPVVWAMTCYGTHYRLWTYRKGEDRLHPIYPAGPGSGAAEYGEFSQDSQRLLDELDSIKNRSVEAEAE